MKINGKDVSEYFPVLQMILAQPFEAAERVGEFDVVDGQAGAVRHGISRALTHFDARAAPSTQGGCLTRDPRVVERKKSFQFWQAYHCKGRRPHGRLFFCAGPDEYAYAWRRFPTGSNSFEAVFQYPSLSGMRWRMTAIADIAIAAYSGYVAAMGPRACPDAGGFCCASGG